MASLVTFPGSPPGDPLRNPVAAPEPGVESKSVRDARADDAYPAHADQLAAAIYDDAAPTYITQAPNGMPELMRPPGHDSRPIRQPRTGWFNWRRFVEFNNHGDVGQHGELVPGANANPGNQRPGLSSHRNTFRNPPAPWDAAVFVTPQEDR